MSDEVRVLVSGRGHGAALVLDEPLSFWGGVDPATGAVIDVHHPQAGSIVAGRVLVLPAGRGSSSSSYVLAESVRSGTAPAAIVLGEPDAIIALGALVATELYGSNLPVVVAPGAALTTGDLVTVDTAADRAIVRS